jgi:hypothetical protein
MFMWLVEVWGLLLTCRVSEAIRVEDEVSRWLRWSLMALRKSFLLFWNWVWLSFFFFFFFVAWILGFVFGLWLL